MENDTKMTWRELRDRILLGVGLTGFTTFLVVWVLTGRTPDPSLLVASLGLIGAPSVLRLDERR